MLSRTWPVRPAGFIQPCLPSPAERPPSGSGWVHEIKHDGFRLMVRRDAAGARLLTRNGHDWTVIDAPSAARKFGDQLLETARSWADRTSISGAIDFAAAQLERAPFEAVRRTIDVSGDGTNNMGRNVKLARDEAVAKGIVVNSLVILTEDPAPWYNEHTHPPGGLEKYYQDNVIGGPGAFVMVAEDFNSFGPVITKKMIAEIAR